MGLLKNKARNQPWGDGEIVSNWLGSRDRKDDRLVEGDGRRGWGLHSRHELEDDC